MVVVHFAIDANVGIRPLCGAWGGVPNWTKFPVAVTCPACLARLDERGRDREDDGGEPPGADTPGS